MIASTQTNNPLGEVPGAPGLTSTQFEQCCQRLKSAGLRITQPRISILSALLKRDSPATIEQLHADLTDKSCDLVTVYRCLAAFEDLGIVRRCYFHNGTSLYQIQVEGSPSYHVVDKATNQVSPLPADLAAELLSVVKKIETRLTAQGNDEVSHMIEFFASKGKPNTVRTQAKITV